MRKWWVWVACLLQAGVLFAATLNPDNAIATSQITPELRASLTRDYEIDIVVKPHEGDAWTRLAKRVTANASRWRQIGPPPTQ